MIYIHVPFCNSFCTYCDFYSEICSQQVQNRYLASLKAEIAARKGELTLARQGHKGQPDTLYIGGGTPSVLAPEAIEAIVQALADATGNDGTYEEFTIEVNPDDIVRKGLEYVQALLGAGVNRISMGIQSFDDGILKWMNRRHDSAQAREAVKILRRAGVTNLSIDLIFGLSQLDADGWDATVHAALDMHPEHISAYALSIEPGSSLAAMVDDGRYIPADDELCESQYRRLCSLLAAAGYRHYEISNFAQPGREAIHNSAYWRRVPYTGLGPGAHSFVRGREEMRLWNSQELHDWTPEQEILTPANGVTERVMLALRTDKGMPRHELEAICGTDRVSEKLGEGLLELHSPSDIRIPESQWFVSDNIITGLLI